MLKVGTSSPHTRLAPVTDWYHGVPVDDPYRWLEDQHSSQTRVWVTEQNNYARTILDSIPGRDRIRDRIRELLDVETYDSVIAQGNRYFFRKRRPGEEQPSIYMREGPAGSDELLIDPSARGTGRYTAVKPLRVSPNGQLLLYEVKQGGERTGTFELLNIGTRQRLPDSLPRGCLRGLVFGPDGNKLYYSHEGAVAERPFYRAAFEHTLGTRFAEDTELFCVGENRDLRLLVSSDGINLAFHIYSLVDTAQREFIVVRLEDVRSRSEFRTIRGVVNVRLVNGRILALTDHDSPNRRIVEVKLRTNGCHELIDVIPECDVRINNWFTVNETVIISYIHERSHRLCVFDLSGRQIGEVPLEHNETARMIGACPDQSELLFEAESFTEPIGIFRYGTQTNARTQWATRRVPFDGSLYTHVQVWYTSNDGTNIPMFLVGRNEIVHGQRVPTIMTSYGGFGTSMTPQFSVFAAFMMEQGCLFAVPNIRGGSEFGKEWHTAAKRQKRQTAYDDFLSAAQWLIESGRCPKDKLAIFGGSNSGLLVGAALTQRPDLFRAAVCMVPMLDMLRYHLFDNAHFWKEEYGTSEQEDDFRALLQYSPYHKVKEGTYYPAVMLVSGDSDQNCNPLHARKMAARLQAANASPHPIILDYSEFRGHSPVLPLSTRIDALTDRMAFLCDQLGLTTE